MPSQPPTDPSPSPPSAPSAPGVLIVGLGPTGAVLAHLLGRAGIPVQVVEREPEHFPRPRAVYFDAEIMRVLQRLGVVERVRNAVLPVRGMDLLNQEGRLLFQYRAPQGPGAQGWEEGFMFHQPELERILRDELVRHASVTLHLGWEVVDCETVPARVRLRGPDGSMRELDARYVIGCDGARSLIREAVGTTLTDYGVDAPWLVLDLIVPDGEGLPDVTVQYCEPERPMTFVPLPGSRCRVEIMVLPGDDPSALSAPDSVTRLLGRWLPPDAYTVERSAVYTFHGLVADRWRRGPLFLAGDAAHQMPPFLGQGMCAGIRDAVNLAWKLERVFAGTASESLLDSYQEERDPHTRQTVEVDIQLGGLIQTTDPTIARMRDEKAAARGGAVPLTPPLFPVGPGLNAPRGDDDAVGFPFPQPILPDGTRHDDLLGHGFALVGAVDPSPLAASLLDRLHTTTIPLPVPPIRQWLEERGAAAALVRPDRLVSALVSDPDELDRALEPLAAHLPASGP